MSQKVPISETVQICLYFWLAAVTMWQGLKLEEGWIHAIGVTLVELELKQVDQTRPSTLSSVSQQSLVAALLKYCDLELEERPSFSVCCSTVYQSNRSVRTLNTADSWNRCHPSVVISAGKPLVLALMWAFQHFCSLSTSAIAPIVHRDQIVPPAGQWVLPHHKNCSGEAQEAWLRAKGIHLDLKCPNSKSD